MLLQKKIVSATGFGFVSSPNLSVIYLGKGVAITCWYKKEDLRRCDCLTDSETVFMPVCLYFPFDDDFPKCYSQKIS